MLLIDDVYQLFPHIGMLGSNVVVLVQVGCQVVKVWRALNNNEFPIVHPHGNLIGFGKLPIKVGVALLCLIVAQ